MLLPKSPFLRHIFLADDDEDDRQLFSEALIEVDQTAILTEAQNGKELMDILSLPPVPLPDVVFLDINMPIKNGFECLEQIRNDKGYLQNLNVVMYSTSKNPENMETAFHLGASFYAVKPNSFASLKLLIESVLQMNWNHSGLIPNRNLIP